MPARRRSAMVVLLVGLATSTCNDPIAQSHIDANVPTAQHFHPLLKRDLEAFFQQRHGSGIVVGYDMLREGPTQTGVAHPKYYVWVTVQASGGLVDEGAVHLAAMEKTRFEVTDFLSKRDIHADPAGVERVFPKALADDIRKRAGRGRPS